MREVQVVPDPEADFLFANACSEEAVQFFDHSNTGGMGDMSYNWNFGDPATGILNSDTLQNPVHTYMFGDSTYYVTLIITNYQGCVDTIVKAIYVRQSPDVAFLWGAACEDTATHFYPDSSLMNVFGVTSWFWDFDDGTFAYEPDPYHQFAATGIYNVTLTVQDTGVCSNSHTAVVIVHESPVALFSGPQTACQQSPVYFDELSYGQGAYISSWYWDFGDGTDTTIYFPDDPDIYHTYAFVGTYAVSLSATGADSCFDQLTQLISVTGSPEALFEFENSCFGESVYFFDQSIPQQGGDIVEWSWNFDDPNSGILNYSNLQNPQHTFTAIGIYDVRLIVTNAGECSDTIILQVDVTAEPPVDFTYEENCLSQATLFFTDTTVTNIASVILYDWNFGDGSPGSNLMNPEHTYSATGSYQVSLTITESSGCIGTVTHEIEVLANPIALYSYEEGCDGSPLQFMDASYTTSGELITGWAWNFDDPVSGPSNCSNEKNPTHLFSDFGMFNVQLLVSTESGCTGSITLPVNVDQGPEADFIYQVGSCTNGLVNFNDVSASPLSQIIEWKWTFEAGYQSQQQNPSHSFLHSDTTYVVSLAVLDNKGCSDTIYKDVYIPDELLAEISDSLNCFGEGMQFAATIIQPLPNSIDSYSWNFGDPASGALNTSEVANPVHVYTHPGVFTVSVEIVDMFDCPAILYKQIIVNELPAADFSYEVDLCDSLFRFSDQSTANGFDIITQIWDFGDGSPPVVLTGSGVGDISHIYSEIGIYEATLIVEGSNGCFNSVSKEVVREACLVPAFEIFSNPNCQYADVLFTENSTIKELIQEWYWDFGDGSDTTYFEPAEFIKHTYERTGEISVSLGISAVINGVLFTDTLSRIFEIMPGPIANFFSNPVCAGGPMNFIDSTENGDAYTVSWHWNFGTGFGGDTSNTQSPIFVYENSGVYDVSLITINNWGCIDTVVKTASVHISPTANFQYTTGCLNEKVEFTDRSFADEGDQITNWRWNFGDPSTNADTSQMQHPIYSYGQLGEKEVELIVYNTIGCPDTLKQFIDVHPIPTAGFTVTENYENEQGRVALEDASMDSEAYYWDFGDGYSLYDDYPPVIHSYEEDGVYRIEQVIWNEFGCPDTAFREYDFMFKTLFVPNALNPNGYDPDTKLFTPKGRNLKYFHIAIYNHWGEILWESTALDAGGRPAESWDGFHEGKLVPSDVYLWKAEAVFRDGTVWEGNVVGHTDDIPTGTSGYVVVVR